MNPFYRPGFLSVCPCGRDTTRKYADAHNGFCKICVTGKKSAFDAAADKAKRRKAALRRGRDQVMKGLGLVKVRGALGGTYWE